MFKLDQMFNCKLCSKLFVDPVTISCGNTICLSHLKGYTSQKTFDCKCCDKQYTVPNEGGFAINIFIQSLQMQLNSIDINPVYGKCKKVIEEANEYVAEIERINILMK